MYGHLSFTEPTVDGNAPGTDTRIDAKPPVPARYDTHNIIPGPI